MGLAQIKMPQLGESVTEGTVDKWLKHEGDLVKIAVTEGETVSVGAVLAQIEVKDAASAAPQAPAKPTREAEVARTEVPPEPAGGRAPDTGAVSAPAENGGGERARLSPAVRKLAAEHRIDAASLRGSGMGGRVTRDDVLAAVGGGQAAAAAPAATRAPAPAAPTRVDGTREELVKLSVMRRSIAEHMVRSLATSPHAWTLQEVDVTNLVRYREAEKENFKKRHGVALTYLPFVVQILCEVLKQYPWLNSTWAADGVILKRYINLGIAVSIPDGLIVPVLKDADQRGFSDLVKTLNDLIERARNKQLKPEDVQAGTFTLNNTGATGSVASQPIINQPQAAILTTESIVKRPVVINDAIAVRQMMAGQFLGTMKKRLEEWTPGSIRL